MFKRLVLIFSIFSIAVLILFGLIFFPIEIWTTHNPFLHQIQITKLEHMLNQSPLSTQGVWDRDYLNQNPEIKNKIEDFSNHKLCVSLKQLDNKNKTYEELKNHLIQAGFSYREEPLQVSLQDRTPRYFLREGGTTEKIVDKKEVITQEIFVNEEGCILRIKKEGFPNSVRSQPHSTKAVLIDAKKKPTFENEAFKITWRGHAVPKGPLIHFGLKNGFKLEDFKKDEKTNVNKYPKSFYIDYIMQESHPDLKM